MSKVAWCADRLRHKHAEQNGLSGEDILPWRQLKDSEQRRWLELAEAAQEALR